MGLAKKAARKVKQALHKQKILSHEEGQDIDANAKARLVELVSDSSSRELVAAFFKKALLDIFVKQEIQRVQRQYRKSKQFKSLTTPSGQLRDFVDTRPQQSATSYLEEIGCPYPELARRLLIENEPIADVLPNELDRQHWYRIQRPEIKRHLEQLYPDRTQRRPRREAAQAVTRGK